MFNHAQLPRCLVTSNLVTSQVLCILTPQSSTGLVCQLAEHLWTDLEEKLEFKLLPTLTDHLVNRSAAESHPAASVC